MFNMLFSRYYSLGGIYYCHFIEKETDLGEILGPHSLQASEPGDLNTGCYFPPCNQRWTWNQGITLRSF